MKVVEYYLYPEFNEEYTIYLSGMGTRQIKKIDNLSTSNNKDRDKILFNRCCNGDGIYRTPKC